MQHTLAQQKAFASASLPMKFAGGHLQSHHVHAYAISLKAVCQIFKAWAKTNFGDYTKASDHYGVSVNFVSRVCNGDAAPPAKMLNDIGWQKVRLYVPARDDHASLPVAAHSDGECPDWATASRQAATAIHKLQAMGLYVTGYDVHLSTADNSPFVQPIISLASSADNRARLGGGQCIGHFTTQDGTLVEAHYGKYFAGCFVRWSETEKVHADIE